MELTKFEKIMLWVMAIAEKIKEYFLRSYPAIALIFSFVYVYGLFEKMSRHKDVASDFQITLIFAIALTVLTLIYIILLLREKLREARLKRWIR